MSVVDGGYTACPRCKGTGYWPPHGHQDHRRTAGQCDWCGGYGALTKAELADYLRAQKQRRLDMLAMSPDQRRALTKWD